MPDGAMHNATICRSARRECTNVPAGLTPEAIGAIEARLGFPCAPNCPQGTCRLVHRMQANGQVVVMQCDGCGRSIGGPLKSSDHPGRISYPTWDDGLRDLYNERAGEEARAALEARRSAIEEQTAVQRRDRQADYARFTATSKEWWTLRGKVMQRAGWRCEACLNADARHVHHLTYGRGWLPPAWLLRAVCEACHSRLHSATDEWGA